MSRQPFLILAAFFILGIFFQDFFSFGSKFIFVFSIFCLVALGFFFFRKKMVFVLKNMLLSLLFFSLGIIFHFFNQPNLPAFNFKTNEILIFKISKKLNSNEKYKKYEAVAEIGSQYFETIINIDKNHNELDFNHFYKANAYLIQPKSPPHDFQFNYSEYLARKGIFYQCFISDRILQAERKDLRFSEKIRQKRLEMLHKIDQSAMNFRSREFQKGIILADRTEMDAETIQDFNRSGLVHFLAISGTHIVVIFGMFYFLMMRFLPAGFRKYAIIISLIFIWIFAAFIGFGNSVVRSCLMITIYFIYVLLQRKPDLLHSVALAALIILMIDTQQLFDVGFQLSFLAVLGIYWLNQPILKLLPKQDHFIKKLIFNTISISVSAQLATLPLVLYYFHQFSLVSVMANFVIVPFSEVIIIFSFLMTTLMGFGINLKFIDGSYDFIIQALLAIIHWFADFDVVFFENIPLNLIEAFALFGIVYLLKFMIEKFNSKNVSNIIVSILVFFVIRISFNIIENQKDEFLVHHYKKEIIISIKNAGHAVFWVNSQKDRAKIQQYIINPYVASRRIHKAEIKTFPYPAKMVKFNNKIYYLN